MAIDNLTAKLYQSQKTVFTTKYLALIWRERGANNLKAKTAYYVNTGVLRRQTRGVFAVGVDYDVKELGASLYVPSYISFETVLREAGIIFQHYETTFLAGPWAITKKIEGHSFTFRRLKDSVLYNSTGITIGPRYSIATPERAFLDTIYLYPEYYFDNLRSIDWERCAELVTMYENKQLVARLKKYQKDYA